ncbi:TetR/AcrR family transcriptional regulator [Streptomyces sp. AcE210]|nr:TetR/AcrR family transcriptional regulator [Streptomyces sp. AcE210]
MAAEPSQGSSRTGRTSRGSELKQERAVRTRAQILHAAAEAFATKGYPSVTVLDVAELTGMTKGAVYFHFANKEALATAVAEEFYRKLGRLSDSVAERDLEPVPRVIAFFTETALAFRDDVVIQAGARLQIERSLIDSALPPPYRDYTDTVSRWLREAEDDGEPAIDSPDAVARVLVAALFGAQHISWVLTDRTDITDRVDEIARVVLGTCRAGTDRGRQRV